MWNVPVEMMCRQHLLGEHLELHMFYNSINEGKKITGYIEKGIFDPPLLKIRHDDIVLEMENRGFNHKTPMPNRVKYHLSDGRVRNMFIIHMTTHPIDINASINELLSRCERCKTFYTIYQANKDLLSSITKSPFSYNTL